jgi:DNA polymerase-3 subunit alpha
MVDILNSETGLKAADIVEKKEGELVAVAGMLTGCRKITTRRKELMMVSNLEDLSGTVPIVFFPRAYEKYSKYLFEDAIVVVKGKVSLDSMSDEKKILCDIVEPLVKGKSGKKVFHVKVDKEKFDSLEHLKKILAGHKGSDPVFIHMDGKVIKVGEEHYVNIEPSIVRKVEEVLGRDTAWVDTN